MTNSSQYDELILEAALIGLEQKKQEVQARIDEIRSTLRGQGRGTASKKQAPSDHAASGNSSAASGGAKKRRTMSAEARERIAAAQRKRWAASKKAAKTKAA